MARVLGLVWAILAGCSEDPVNRAQGDGGSSGHPTTASGGSSADGSSGSSAGGAAGHGGASGSGSGGASKVPTKFVPADYGGYALGPAITGSGFDPGVPAPASGSGCSVLAGVVRDFKGEPEAGGHPDFESFVSRTATMGLVLRDLGADGKPVYSGLCEVGAAPAATCPDGAVTTTKANFDLWYRYAANVNKPFVLYLQILPDGNLTAFHSTSFFPLDGAGFGNTPGEMHNYSFTTEFHLKFIFDPDARFDFTGDDDVWVFIDGRLVMDIGGPHPEAMGDLPLDSIASELGLVRGQEYRIDIFHAERHTTESNYSIDTGIRFTGCGTIPPDTGI